MEKKELTAADVWAMFAETDRMMRELRAERVLELRELDKRMGSIKEEIAIDLKELDKRMGNISDNIGFHPEQFFQDIFKRKLEFGRVKYDEMVRNLHYKGKKEEIEFDIVLINGDSVALIEVKHRIHPNFVRELAEDRVGMFRKFFPEFEGYTAYLGIAGFSFCDEVLEQASRYGIGIIKQVGEGVEIQANNLKAY